MPRSVKPTTFENEINEQKAYTLASRSRSSAGPPSLMVLMPEGVQY
jgi:hypothetical protein